MNYRISSLLTLLGLIGTGCSGPTEPVAIATIQVTAPSTTLASGATVQLTAATLGKNGKALTDRVVTWSSSNQTIATVSATGLVTAGSVLGGTAESVTITASAEGVVGTASISINPVPVSRIVLSLDSLMLRVGDSLRLTARLIGTSGSELTGRDLQWKSMDTTVASISPTGLVTTTTHYGARYRSTRILVTHLQFSDTAVIVARPFAPSLTLTTTDTVVRVGQVGILRWTSQYAVTCQGTELAQSVTGLSGEAAIRPDSGGRRWSIVSCTGDGGSISDSIHVVTPYPTLPTSYENFKTYVVVPMASGNPIVPSCQRNGYGQPVANGRGYADFLQNGTITLADIISGPPMGIHTDPGIICIWQRNANGQWIDISNTLLANDRGCVGGANKSLVADFNQDARPDIFFLCTGTKWAPDGSKLDYQPGGTSLWLTSEPDGKYRTTYMNYPAYAHGGAAGDVNGDGYPDVVFCNCSVIQVNGVQQPSYLTILQNDRQGNFIRKDELITLPDGLRQASMTAIELIDVDEDGALDILVASGGYQTFILWGDKNGTFPNTRPPARLPFAQPERNYNGAHNFHKVGRFLYSWNVINSIDWTETGNTLQRISIDTWTAETIWRRTTPYLIDGWWNVDSWGQIRMHNGKFIHDLVVGLTINP